MRKNNGTLNPALSRLISETGHTDEIVITDAGLPIPRSIQRVDLALTQGIPGFLQVLDTVLDELAVEGMLVSSEIREASPEMFREIEERATQLGVKIQFLPHTDFKARTHQARGAVRSGETTSYANVILQAGVIY